MGSRAAEPVLPTLLGGGHAATEAETEHDSTCAVNSCADAAHQNTCRSPQGFAGRRRCGWDRLHSEVCPFRLLRQGAREEQHVDIQKQDPCACRRSIRTSETYLLIFLGWIVAATACAYILLAMSAGTGNFSVSKDDKAKYPQVGQHRVYVVMGKQVLMVLLIHRLCRHTMAPLEAMANVRDADPELNSPGVFMFLRSRWDRLWGRTGRENWWFSTFVTDHILLVAVGTCFLCFQVVLLMLRIEDAQDGHVAGGPVRFLVLAGLTAYVGFLVKGFLITTLENHAVPKKGKEREFMSLMLLIIILWMTEFLVLLGDRKRYLAFTAPTHLVRLKRSSFTRFLAGAAQVFITHSSVMLGAVLCGHACHFKKCPDLQWRTLLTKFLPCGLVLAVNAIWIHVYTVGQWHPECGGMAYKLAAIYPQLMYIAKAVGGTILLVASLWIGSMHEPVLGAIGDEACNEHAEKLAPVHENASDKHGVDEAAMDLQRILANLFDYDAVLVLLTFFAAVMWDIVAIFVARSMLAWVSYTAEFANALAPVGLAMFVLVAWRRPCPGGTAQARFHWLALLLACMCFNDFQYKEDCAMTSPLPHCCQFPGLADFNKKKASLCNVDARCRSQFAPPPELLQGKDKGANTGKEEPQPMYCFPKDFAEIPLGSSQPQSPREVGAPGCRVLLQRWQNYTQSPKASKYLKFESDKAGGLASMAYKVLSVLGKVASVEFYFTALGVLLKLILRAEHPRSLEILEAAEHHGSAQGGQMHVVAIRLSRTGSFLAAPFAASVQRARWQLAVATALQQQAKSSPSAPAPSPPTADAIGRQEHLPP